MRRMPNKRLKALQVNWLITNRILSSGAEAVICRTKNPHTLYKIFTKASKPIPMCDNKKEKLVGVIESTNNLLISNIKKEKIKKLYQMSLENSTHPIRTLSCNGDLIGYEMTYDPNDGRFSPYYLSSDEMIHFLEESKKR